MFRSIDYNLRFFLLLALITAMTLPVLYMNQYYMGLGGASLLLLYFIFRINRLYNRINKKISFLFNAIENGDYSFHFDDSVGSKREQELLSTMNRIKEILSDTKQEIIEKEKFYTLIFDNVSTGIIVLDTQNNIHSVNQSSLRLLGLPVFTHINQLKSINPILPELILNIIPQKESRQIKLSSEYGETELHIKADRIKLKEKEMKIVILNNIDDELDHKEVESWIKLIRVMTHEIMNSIAPITSLTDTLLYQAKQNNLDSTSLIEGLEAIHLTSKELLLFVESYRKFTRISTPKFNYIDINKITRKAIILSKEDYTTSDIPIQFEENSISPIYADSSHIMLVLLNLIKNALQATASEKQPEVMIYVYENQDYTIIKVCNRGLPIPENNLNQIFIPFFTTKENGSGIGLSICRHIMSMHKGSIKYQHQNGITTFSISFPR